MRIACINFSCLENIILENGYAISFLQLIRLKYVFLADDNVHQFKVQSVVSKQIFHGIWADLLDKS
jgi:hypothetical protein